MESIFSNFESTQFWLDLPNNFQQHLQDFSTFLSLKSKQNRSFSKYQLTSDTLLKLNPANSPIRFTSIRTKLFSPFIENSSKNVLFGFKLGAKDFYVDSQKSLDSYLEYFRKFCILDSFEQDFVIIKELGKGCSCTVYLIQDLQTGKQFAGKLISKAFLMDKKRLKNLINEINILQSIDHQNIAKLYHVYETTDSVILIMEYLPNGDLYKRVTKKNFFSEQDCLKFAKNLLEVLEYTHSKSIVHRDLKLENIMMTSENDFSFKLIDFGLAYISDQCQIHRCGSPGYIAPEILSKKQYNHKIDIFSAGVVLYILRTGKHPFNGSNTAQILNNNLKCEFSKDIRGLCKNIILRMMRKQPEDRPEAWELLDELFRKEGFSSTLSEY